MTIGLLIIDLQNDYFPGGAMELENSAAAGRLAGRLLAFFRDRRWPVVHLQHLSLRPGATFFRPQTPGVEIHPAVTPTAGEAVIQKHFPNGFRETDLQARLRALGVEELVIAGMMTHMCVDATTRAAVDLGFACRVVQDACATRALTLAGRTVAAADVHAAFLAALNGSYGRVLTAEQALAELTPGLPAAH